MRGEKLSILLVLLLLISSCAQLDPYIKSIGSYIKNIGRMSEKDQVILIHSFKKRDWKAVKKISNVYFQKTKIWYEIKKIKEVLKDYDICKNIKSGPSGVYGCLAGERPSLSERMPNRVQSGDLIVQYIWSFNKNLLKEMTDLRAAAATRARLKEAERQNAEIRERNKKNQERARRLREKREKARLKKEKARKARLERTLALEAEEEAWRLKKIQKERQREETRKAQKREIVKKVESEKFQESALYTKKSMSSFLTIVLAVNLNNENIQYTDILIDVLNKEARVSHLKVEVFPKYLDISPSKEENIRIASLACQGTGEATTKSRWKSKYLKIVIGQTGLVNRLSLIFLTQECREFSRLLLKGERGKATLHWMDIFVRALVRGKDKSDLLAEKQKKRTLSSEKREELTLDITYSVEVKIARNKVWRRVKVHLSRKPTKAQLKKIALEIKQSDSYSYERTLIDNFLPESGCCYAWATTHFNPDLEIKIYGLTIEQENRLRKDKKKPKGQIIGAWLLDDHSISKKLTIYSQGGDLKMERKYPDLSHDSVEMIQDLSAGEKQFKRKGVPDSSSDYYLINKIGNLEIWDKDGLITTAYKLK